MIQNWATFLVVERNLNRVRITSTPRTGLGAQNKEFDLYGSIKREHKVDNNVAW